MPVRTFVVAFSLLLAITAVGDASDTVSTRPAELVFSGPVSAIDVEWTKASQTILNDDFEGAFPGPWQLFAATDTGWGTSSYRAAGGSSSAYCAGDGSSPAPQGGPYPNNMQSWMIFGPFSLADATAANAAFDVWMKTQPVAGDVYNDYLFYGLSLNGSNFSGFKTAGDTQGWYAASFDFSEITALATIGATQVWFGIGFVSDSSVTDEGVYIDNVVLTKTTPTPCSITCSASAPGSGQTGVPISFTASATASNCVGSPSYRWSFGDGSPASTVRNPSHSYGAAGTYSWNMTASVDDQSCQRSGSITIGGSSATYNRGYWVPAAAHGAGSMGSQWRTDLGIHNPGDSSTEVRVDFHDGAAVHSLSRTLGPSATSLLEDVIGMYNLDASGALEILAEDDIFVTSRTYNQSGSGSFGQYLDGVDPASALSSGQSAELPQLREDSSFRTNIGLLNTSGAGATVEVGLYDGSGALLRTFTRSLSPGVLKQENRPYWALANRSDIDRGSARVTVTSGAGVVAYASVIDNRTQDPTTIPMKMAATELRQGWVAAAAHASGSMGSQWRTDLGLLNRQGSTAQVTVALHSGATSQMTTTVGPGDQKVLSDVVGLIGVNGSGSLEITSDVPIYITSRTYNDGGSGTFGQFLDGESTETGVGAGQIVFLSQLSENSSYRSNIGFVNTSSAPAAVSVELLTPSGSVAGQFSQTLSAGESWQKNRPFSTVAGRNNISGGAARIEVTSGAGVIAYGSVIDNQTQDPTTIPMKGAGGVGVVSGTVGEPGGFAISNARVEAAGQSTLTNSQGYYVLDNVPLTSSLPITYSKDGYVPTVKRLRIVDGESNTQNVVLLRVETTATISGTSGGSVTTPDGASISIPPNSLVDGNGQPFTGTASVSLTSFDPSVPDELDAFPGTFEGVDLSGQTVFINTYGFADITVTSGSQILQLSPGATATLDIPIPTTLQSGAPATIPSWWFDPDRHTWYEVGTFNRAANKFRTRISHFSIWNCDVASTRCYVSGRVVNENMVAVKGARVTFRSFRSNGGYVTSGETSTPENGTFRVPVDANADIEFWAEKSGVESAHRFEHACEHNGEMSVGDLVLGLGGGGSVIGITLTWGDEPRDLDSHLTVPISGGWEHLYYSHRSGSGASLDTDDTDGYGPEIFTIEDIQDGVYRYSVHQYSGSGSFPTSGARVSVVGGGVSYRLFTPPASGAQGDDDVWRVFDLMCHDQSCTLAPINDYLHDVSAGDAGSFEP